MIISRNLYPVALALIVLLLVACSAPAQSTAPEPTSTAAPVVTTVETADSTATPEPAPQTAVLADVISVNVSGDPGSYQFSVEISSPDSGCEQFADWWEVVSVDGKLLYRRILLHSHVNEQPFTRSGGPVAIDNNVAVIVRAHMSSGGYGGQAMRGRAGGNFEPITLERGFAADLETAEPLPEGCAG